MTCQAIQAAETTEKYVQGHLTEAENQAFEKHFFDCAACFEELQVVQDIQAELARLQNARARSPETRRKRRRRNHQAPKYGWLGAAAAVMVAAVALAMALMQRRPVDPQPAVAAIAERAPAEKPVPPPAPPSAPVLDHAAIGLLARVKPPEYFAPMHGKDDDAARRFRQAMDPYGRQDYRQALLELRVAAALDRRAPEPRFYLGVCELVLGQVDEAISDLREVVDLGETPYLEEAHFFLAKALLAKEDLHGATDELYKTIRQAGDRLAEARRILDQVTEMHPR
jgi:tetratricopeptide (TPR) repeat protein